MKRLVWTACVVSALLALDVGSSAASTRDAPIGWGKKAAVSWIEHDPDNLLRMLGNTYDVVLAAEENPLGRSVRGRIGIYRCRPGELIGGPDPGPGQCAYLDSLTLREADPAATVFTLHGATGSAAFRAPMAARRDDGSPAGAV